MTPEQQKQYEEIKLQQYLEWAKKNRPSILARLLGALKKGKKEKPSPHKQEICRSNLEKARAKRWPKDESCPDSKNEQDESGSGHQ